jgi:SAM-dependent methyltransferase
VDNAAYFRASFKERPEREGVWEAIAQYLQRYVPLDSVLLDLGAGYCNFVNNIKAKEKHAVDVFPDIAKFASSGIAACQQSILNLDNFKTAYFDVIFASNIFEHLSSEETERVMPQLKRILKPGGKLIIIQPNFRYAYKVYFDDYTHKQIFTANGLSEFLASHGFLVRVRKDRFLPFSMRAGIPKCKLFVKLYLSLPLKPFGGQMLFVAHKENQDV